MDNFTSVFDCHPNVDEIFVVDDMPFLEPSHAQSHALSTGKPVKNIKRSDALKPQKGKVEDPKDSETSQDAALDPSSETLPPVKKGRGKK